MIRVTADVVLFARRARGRDWSLVLIRRKHPPFQGRWALPGGFVEEDEPLESAARRELKEETGVRSLRLEQIGAFGEPGRDPRGRTVTVAFVGFVSAARVNLRAGDDASDAQWHPVRRLPRLAFDHHKIIKKALARVRRA